MHLRVCLWYFLWGSKVHVEYADEKASIVVESHRELEENNSRINETRAKKRLTELPGATVYCLNATVVHLCGFFHACHMYMVLSCWVEFIAICQWSTIHIFIALCGICLHFFYIVLVSDFFLVLFFFVNSLTDNSEVLNIGRLQLIFHLFGSPNAIMLSSSSLGRALK